MRIALYVRVSTLRQAQAQTIEQQLTRLDQHVADQGWVVLPHQRFRDDGYSGASLYRPGLERLRDAVAAGEVDRVLLTAPDRLARNYVHQALLLEELGRGGCVVEFLDRPMSEDPHDQLLLQIRGAVAEYERSVIAERMRRGRQMKLRAGLLLPWTRAPYGYRLDLERPRDPAGVRVEATEAIVVQELFATYIEEGLGLIGLAKALSRRGLVTPNGHAHWNSATVRGILTNPSYTGQVYAGRTQARPPRGRHSALRPIGRPSTTQAPLPREDWIAVATIPALISAEQFEQVQAKLAQNQQFARRNNTARDYLLRALVSCGHCRTACTGRSDRKKRYDYYVCRAKGPAVASHREEHCPARYIPVQQLDELVWQDLCVVLTHPASVAQALARAQGGHWSSQELHARRELLRKGQGSLDQQLERLTEAYLGGVMPLTEYQRRRGEVEQKRQGLAQQHQHLEAQATRHLDVAAQVQGAEAFCQRMQAGLAAATFAQKRHLVELLIDRVVVTDEEVEIRYVVPTSPRGEHTRFCHLRLDYFVGPVTALAAGNGNGQVPDNVPPWLADATLTGHANPNGQATVSVYLNWRNEQGLASFLRNLYLPRTKEYGHYLTPEQFRAAYAPAASDVQAVKDFLSGKGLKVAYNPANNLYVDATGSITQLEKAFGVTENVYSYQGKTLRANAEAPTVPAALGEIVAFIGGLDESELLNEPYIRGDRNAPPGGGYATPGPCSAFWNDHSATVTPPAYQYGATLPWVPCGYTPAQIRAAYGIDKTGLTGKGVRVGIVDAFASPTIVQDVNQFSAHYGLPQLTASTFQQIVAPGIYNKPENPQYDPQGWYGEQTLDIEWVHAIAPEATIVYAGGNTTRVPLDHALIHLVDNHLVDIVSNSWGYNGEISNYGHIQANERAFMQAAAEGISVLFSSGDDGDVAAIRGVAMASYPASSPWVTAVGGTSLALLNATGAKQEYGWGTYNSALAGSHTSADGKSVTGNSWSPWPPAFQYGSGGGVSLIFGQPSYQEGVVPAALSTQTTTLAGKTINLGGPHRVTPDIAMVGDPNTGVLVGETYQVSGDPLIDAGCTPFGGGLEYCERRIGGTSLSSPLFAGVLALADQARFTAGKGPIGFVNPSLYAIGSGAAIADVTPPTTPTAVLRNGGADGQAATIRTINSVPLGTSGKVIEGADTSLTTAAGYDNVTGLGTPVGTNFVTAIGNRP